jgi:uncharacterized membrane protein YccC
MNNRPVQFFVLVLLGVLAWPLSRVVGAAESVVPSAQKSEVPKFSTEERNRRKQQIKERLAKQISELRRKRANGDLAEEDRKRLQRLEEIAARLHRGASNAPGNGVLASPAKPATKAK